MINNNPAPDEYIYVALFSSLTDVTLEDFVLSMPSWFKTNGMHTSLKVRT